MHKKTVVKLMNLAQHILDTKGNADISELQENARRIYEKLTVLKFANSFVNADLEVADTAEKMETSNEKPVFEISSQEKVEAEDTLKVTEENKQIHVVSEDDSEKRHKVEGAIEENKEPNESDLKGALEDEFKDAISADIAMELFENVTKDSPEIDKEPENKKRSLNDSIFKSNIQLGLNDRIAFVTHLFDGSQVDFNRVISQLNSFKTEKEAKDFIVKLVKPEYDWSAKEEYEQRLMNLIERKFL